MSPKQTHGRTHTHAHTYPECVPWSACERAWRSWIPPRKNGVAAAVTSPPRHFSLSLCVCRCVPLSETARASTQVAEEWGMRRTFSSFFLLLLLCCSPPCSSEEWGNEGAIRSRHAPSSPPVPWKKHRMSFGFFQRPPFPSQSKKTKKACTRRAEERVSNYTCALLPTLPQAHAHTLTQKKVTGRRRRVFFFFPSPRTTQKRESAAAWTTGLWGCYLPWRHTRPRCPRPPWGHLQTGLRGRSR